MPDPNPNMMNRGAAMVAAKLKTFAAGVVVYQSAAVSITLRATVGDTQSEAGNLDGLVTRAFTRDYLIDAADLVDGDPQHGGAQIEPTRGDTITDGNQIYEVLPIDSHGCWRWSDRDNTRRRIHTKWIETINV